MLIFTLTASLIVAFIMNPVFAVDFMNHPEGEHHKKTDIFKKRGFWIAVVLGILLDLAGMTFFGNLLLFIVILVVLNKLFINDMIRGFQNRVLPAVMRRYETLLRWSLKGWRPVYLLLGTIAFFFVSLFIFIGSIATQRVGVVFFPNADPNYIYVYLKEPVGTNVVYTDSVTRVLEARVNKVLGIDIEKGKKNPIVESVIANVGVGAADPASGDRSTRPELGRVQVSFVEFKNRNGISTAAYLDSIREAVKGIPGAEISVNQESSGPPTEPPINIEIASEDFDNLIKTAVNLKNYLDSIRVPGVEELKMDVDLTNPEVSLTVNRERANIEGVTSAQIGMQIRTAVFGREVSKIKEGEDEYKIQLRNQELQRKNLADLLNMRITFRDMASGQVKSVPISSLVDVDYTTTLGSVKRKDNKRTIILRSNVLTSQGYTPTAVNAQIKSYIDRFTGKQEGVTIKQTGEGEQQAETGAFLGKALVIALMIILFILVLQFNSVSKSVIILTEIIFSLIGVFLGFALTGMEVSIAFTGLGIVGLAGIVVKNGILVIEFADELRSRGLKTREAVIQAGKTRIIPVMLTALAAIFGLIPLGIGFNINFISMFQHLDPQIWIGGDSARFWKPLAWTIIFGLISAFFMTLVIVPSMYVIAERLRRPMRRQFGGKWVSMMGIPPLTILFMLMMIYTSIVHRFEKARRRRKLQGQKVNKAFIGSWF
jgi:multidrug efflux pump subunit AcrB